MKKNADPVRPIQRQPRVLTLAAAVKYINSCGFCMLFATKNVRLPSLYYAVTRRSLADGWIWDKYSEMVWRWKDELPRRRLACYAKYFRGRGTLISLLQLPNFLAARQAVVGPGDFDRFYRAGRIRDDARAIWAALEEHGPMATLELRNVCHMDTKAGNKRFKRAILDLQCSLIVARFGAEQETKAWASGRYELIHRIFPKQHKLAGRILKAEAQNNIAAKFLQWQPDATPMLVARLFGWTKSEAIAACGVPSRAVRVRK
jgi:hypothetical protein